MFPDAGSKGPPQRAKRENRLLGQGDSGDLKSICYNKPLHPKISTHTLHTVPNKFPRVFTRKICSTTFFC